MPNLKTPKYCHHWGMTKEEKTQLKEKIEQKINRLHEDIADLEELTQPIAPENAIGRVSRMDAINNKAVNEQALRQARAKLSKLEQALAHIDQPSFGKCSRCGQQIPMARILFKPESTRCVNCADR